MSTPLIRSSKPVFPKEDLKPLLSQIRKVIEEGQFRFGKNVTLFEELTAQYLEAKNAVALDSDSSAYETALRYFDIENGEVVVCTNSFISVPNSVVFTGGKVVFADIKANSLSMDPDSLRRNITSNTRGVIVTHISGFPNPDLKEIIAICRQKGLFLIEDATHSIGALVDGKKVGTFGDAAVFAFTPTKVLTTGEGSMLVTNNNELAQFAKRYSFYGSGTQKGNFVNIGRHMVLPEISSVLGIFQLKRLDDFIKRRNEIGAYYDETFDKINNLQTIKCSVGWRSSYYKYPLILNAKIDKAKFTNLLLKDYRIETGNVFYPPCHLQDVYQNLGVTYGNLSTSETVLARTITLPMHVGLTNEEAAYVIDKVKMLATSF